MYQQVRTVRIDLSHKQFTYAYNVDTIISMNDTHATNNSIVQNSGQKNEPKYNADSPIAALSKLRTSAA